jgi:hypothetical protein
VKRWILTAILLGAIFVTVKVFANLTIFGEDLKRWFNGITTGLSICLGLNYASSMKSMAIDARWKILSKEPHTAREVDLILGCDSMEKVSALAWTSKKKFATLLCCLIWLLLNIVSLNPVPYIRLSINLP